QATNKTLLFLHQRLDVGGHYGVKNAAKVREVMEQSGKTLAVFQGHAHQNDYKEIAGIHYCTLPALVEETGAANNAYATLDAFADGHIKIHGFRRQTGYEWHA
ncbi:MAG: alkaline phosphatase, partial [Pirellulaceae bacterium]